MSTNIEGYGKWEFIRSYFGRSFTSNVDKKAMRKNLKNQCVKLYFHEKVNKRLRYQ